jgi:hypothetical protein
MSCLSRSSDLFTRRPFHLLIVALLLAALAALTAQHAHTADTTYYVHDGANGSGCTSWDDACDSLQAALGKATTRMGLANLFEI